MTALLQLPPQTVLTIELPGEPRGKGRPRFSRQSGRTYTDGATREYETNLRVLAGHVMGGRVPFQGALIVRVEAYFQPPASWSGKKRLAAQAGLVHHTTRPDADNLVKMLDALNTVVWLDDKQIVDLQLIKSYSDRPRYVIEVRAL